MKIMKMKYKNHKKSLFNKISKNFQKIKPNHNYKK